MNGDANGAQYGPDAIAWVSNILTLVTSGGFGALVWYLVVKHIPWIEDRHARERAEWRTFIRDRDETLLRELDSRDAVIKEALTEFRTAIRENVAAVRDEVRTLGGR